MDNQLLNDHCRLQAEHEKLEEAVKDFLEKREALDNSQADAFSHQGQRVQRRQQELQEAKQKLEDLVKSK